jgi:hypothetical protein
MYLDPFPCSCLVLSGGIAADNVAAWLAAGAAVVGMGSCLVGDDIRVLDPTPENLAVGDACSVLCAVHSYRWLREFRAQIATAKWEASGRDQAAALFQHLSTLRR